MYVQIVSTPINYPTSAHDQNFHPKTTTSDLQPILKKAIEDKIDDRLTVIAYHKNVTPKMLQMIAETPNMVEAHKEVAKNTKINVATQLLLQQLGEEDYQIAINLASNQTLNMDILVGLMSHSEQKVLAGVAKNPKTTTEMLEVIYQKALTNPYFRESFELPNALAENLNLSPVMMEDMLNRTIFINQNTSSVEYFGVPELVRRRLQSHPLLSAHLVNRIAFDDSLEPIDRWDIASKSNCDDDTFELLVNSDEGYSWSGLCDNPRTPTWILKQILFFYGEDNIKKHSIDIMRKMLKHDNATNDIVQAIFDNYKRKQVQTAAFNLLYSRGFVNPDWPVEWVEAHYGVKIPTRFK